MNFLVTMGGVDYDETIQRTLEMAPSVGVDRIRVYDDVWVKQHPFYETNRWLWNAQPQLGFGWHAWKPLIILDTMQHAKDGDIILYVDGDTHPTGQSLIPLYETAHRDGAMLFDCSGRMQRQWCQRDCYIVMGQDEPKYHDSIAGCARFGLFKKGDWKAFQFLCEWLTYCCNPLANTHTVREPLRPELPGFTREHPQHSEHRTDQAIYTLLAHKLGFKLHLEASEYSGASAAPKEHIQYFSQQHSTRNNNPAGQGSKWRNV